VLSSCIYVIVDPVTNTWFSPKAGFRPDKPVTCKADGYPRPSFHWIRASDNSTVATDAELVTKFANDSYICVATNTMRRQQYTAMSTKINFDAAAGIHLQLS